MAFTNFCCRSGGSNLNAGTLTGDSTEPGVLPSFEYASGNWDATTGVFTVASGNPLTDGVAVGDFASVYVVGATVTGFVGRVTARDATTITVSLVAKSGTAPTNGTGDRTLRIGGAWQGPNATEGFPFGFAVNTCTNAAADRVRVNFKNHSPYNITAAIVMNLAGMGNTQWAGYATAYGDDGLATIDGGTTSVASYTILAVGGAANGVHLLNFVFANNGGAGSTGSADGVTFASAGQIRNCVFHDMQGSGLNWSIGNEIADCEAYACNKSNTANKGGFASATTSQAIRRCYSHDNIGSNSDGFCVTGHVAVWDRCVAAANGKRGVFNSGATAPVIVSSCDFWGNGSDGLVLAISVNITIENSNFVANGGYGINLNTPLQPGRIRNCGFGSGTQANVSGTINAPGNTVEIGTVIYSANITPWNAPANGDFSLVLPSARGAGWTGMPPHNSGGNPTISKPDIGAAQRGGTFPTAAQVETGVTFGAAGTEYTGTFAGGGGYTYGDEDPAYVLTTATGAGTLDLSLYALLAGITWPALDAVDGGVQFGPVTGLEYEGTGMTSAEVEAAITAALATGVNVTQVEGIDATDALQAAATAAITAAAIPAGVVSALGNGSALTEAGGTGDHLTEIPKTGYKLASDGLDLITATEPAGRPTTFPGWIMWLVQRFRRADKTATALTVKTETGTTVTTQAITSSGDNETLGPPT